ncbi:hypothetical protein BDQ17DRAFT_1340208 [Cyathus striatus]|nr:hypothetical protein BDQ17DRAFT_1340208 [Cyathus striatus]
MPRYFFIRFQREMNGWKDFSDPLYNTKTYNEINRTKILYAPLAYLHICSFSNPYLGRELECYCWLVITTRNTKANRKPLSQPHSGLEGVRLRDLC